MRKLTSADSHTSRNQCEHLSSIMISFITILNVFILSATSQDCPLTMKYLQKKTGLMKIESTPVQSLMDCVAICLHRHRCEAVTLMTNQCTLHSTSESYKNKGFAFHVGNISWSQRFLLWKSGKKKYEHDTIEAMTHITYRTVTGTSALALSTSATTESKTKTTPHYTVEPTTASSTESTTKSTMKSTTALSKTRTALSKMKSTTILIKTTTVESALTTASTLMKTSKSTTTLASTSTTASTTSLSRALTTALVSTMAPEAGATTQRGLTITKVAEEKCSTLKSYSYLADVDMCVRLVEESAMTWSEARRFCAVDGGDLVKLNTEKKYRECYRYMKTQGKGGFGSFGVFSSRVWIGLQTSRKKSKWVDGSPMTYTKTAKSTSAILECVQIGRGFVKMWFNKDCNSTSEMFLCEVV